jgi:hypothetical protein
LVELNILPEECARKGGNAVAPGLVERRRRVIRESLKDGLRVWVERRAVLMEKRKVEDGEKEKIGVKEAVRRFTRRVLEEGHGMDGGTMISERNKDKRQARWGKDVEIARRLDERRRRRMGVLGAQNGDVGCSQPTRAHVLGLRRFWEGVIKTAAG